MDFFDLFFLCDYLGNGLEVLVYLTKGLIGHSFQQMGLVFEELIDLKSYASQTLVLVLHALLLEPIHYKNPLFFSKLGHLGLGVGLLL